MPLPEDTILENRYRIDRLLGQGGMGAIYRGFDTRLNRRVAIKENFFQTPHAIQQFRHEAIMLADLTHPNLPRVIDHFSVEGQQYLVMDFIAGQDLWEIVKEQQHPLAETQGLDYIRQVCEAVQYLHERKPPIIHRDIKPQNIKITPGGRAVLVDFGIAKIAEEDARTSTGARGVTPGFSPLEQYSGSGTTPVSDVYSLGATLYALLTGQKPPDSASLIVNRAKFIPPGELNPKLSRHVSQAIIHAMQPQPVDRPQSVAAWQKALEAILETPTLSTTVDEQLETDFPIAAPAAPVEDVEAEWLTELDPTREPAPSSGPPSASLPPVPQPAAQPCLSRGLLASGAIALIGGAVTLLVIVGTIIFFAFGGGADEPIPTASSTSPSAVVLPDNEPTNTPQPTATLDVEATIAVALKQTGEAKATDTPIPKPTNTPSPPTDTLVPPTNTPAPPTNTPEPMPTPEPTKPAVDFVVTEAYMIPNPDYNTCPGAHQIYVTVLDVNGNPLDGVTIEDTFKAVPPKVSGQKGPGKVEYDLWNNGFSLEVTKKEDGIPATSEVTPNLSSWDEDIPDQWLVDANYCQDLADCAARKSNNQLCRGHYAYNVIFKKTY